MKQPIVHRYHYRTNSHPFGAQDSVVVRLACGHEKAYKGSKAPKAYVHCRECDREAKIREQYGDRTPPGGE